MLRTIALTAAVALAAAPSFAQSIDCSLPANAESNACLALPVMSSQGVGDFVTFQNEIFVVVAVLGSMLVLGTQGDGDSVTNTFRVDSSAVN